MKWKNTILFFLIACICSPVLAQTMGLLQHDAGSDNGYILFAPVMSTNTYLTDKCGKEVHRWTSAYTPGQSVYLLPDGSLLRTGNTNNMTFDAGGSGGIIERIDWSSSLLWSLAISDTNQCQHHDVCYLANGHILAIVWEKKSVAEAIAMGRNPALLGTSLWSEKIVELQPMGSGGATIVWEWHTWDHLNQDYSPLLPGYGTVSNHPELVDVNYYTGMPTNKDWLHINAVTYNAALDQVMLSVHNFNEIWIIDHSTTTSQATGHTGGIRGKGGDLLYRWGNAAAYGQGTATDKKFYGQHNAQWIAAGLTDAGKIMVFNNGQGRPGGNFSTIDIIEQPVDASGNYSFTPGTAYLPAAPAWTYQAGTPADFFGANISGVQRLKTGNTLICNGPSGTFFEINPVKEIVWKYINPVNGSGPMTQGTTPIKNSVFRCSQYDAAYSAFTGHTLAAGAPIEINPLPYSCGTTATSLVMQEATTAVVNPFTDVILFKPGQDLHSATVTLTNVNGQAAGRWHFETLSATHFVSIPVDLTLPGGIFILTISGEGYSTHTRVFKQ